MQTVSDSRRPLFSFHFFVEYNLAAPEYNLAAPEYNLAAPEYNLTAHLTPLAFTPEGIVLGFLGTKAHLEINKVSK